MIRYAVADDFYKIMDIENACFPYPYTENEMISLLASNEARAIESKEIVVGYMCYYQTKQGNYVIESLGVHPKFQRKGYGKEGVDYLKKFLQGEKVIAYVAEFNTDAHLFFKKNGFKCTRIVKGRYDCDELSYRFVWRKDGN
jgi:ribosomal protein S18 acetylase RimI-like enzyme